ncbi:hypothetical protein HPB49_008706 [Dermacentor silvarum]|uniref:Uncharacterized protein n=1 Tax=Dermacentor silvarum TaxID=543639 RepID=A0ACB8CWG1_DERSI|nr:hypothetical protein HPB49_008706 [Dermacentor silvarum]
MTTGPPLAVFLDSCKSSNLHQAGRVSSELLNTDHHQGHEQGKRRPSRLPFLLDLAAGQSLRPFSTFSNLFCDLPRHRRAKHSVQRPTPSVCATRSCVPRHTCGRCRPFSPPPPKPLATIQAADMAYQVEGVSITPAELEADLRWIRGVKAHCAAAAHQAIASTPPASPPSKTPTPPPAITPSTTTLRRHAPLPRLPAEDFKIQILCTLATIDYATARTADRVRINPYNNYLTISTPSEPRARLYLRVSELRLGPTSYPLRTYMAAPDNTLRGIIYNAVDSQTQDEIVQDLQAMNVNTPYAIAAASQMGRSQSILITFVGTTTLPIAIVLNCGIYRCHPGAQVTGSRPCKLWFDRNGPSSPPATSKPQPPPPAPPTGPIHKTSRPSRRRSPSRGARSASRHRSVSLPPLPRSEASTAPTTTSPVSWKSQPHTSDPQTAALKATIAAQQLQIQELSHHLQAALPRLSTPAPSPPPCPATAPSQTLPQPAPAEEPMNTAPSVASSRASSATLHPPHKCRSPSSDDVAPEQARQSATEATLAHLSLPASLTPAATPTPSVDWDRFRSTRLSISSSAPITDLSAWTETLLADVHAATSTLPAAPHSTTADSRLLHLWEAYHAVHRRWQAQKHNRRLRLRLARLASDMEEHCSSLLRQQWGQTCDRMAGNLGLRDTWSLLRVLLDPTHTKASQRKDISHLLHSSPLTDTDFLAVLRDRYLCTDPPTTLPAYTGSPNPDLEADISLGEVRAALLTLRTTSAPGADRITNKALRNLGPVEQREPPRSGVSTSGNPPWLT